MYYAACLHNRQHLQRYESDNSMLGVQSVEQAEGLIGEYLRDWAAGKYFMLGAFTKDSGDFAVQVYLGVNNWELPEFEVGFIADVEHEGQGYVSEAVRAALGLIFGPLGGWRAGLHCRESNLRSQRVAERCGFRLEGHIRENKRLPDGTFEGDYYYGLLKSEYEKQE
jgi:RimJ/RimL family protein N-acetyltransferase